MTGKNEWEKAARAAREIGLTVDRGQTAKQINDAVENQLAVNSAAAKEEPESGSEPTYFSILKKHKCTNPLALAPLIEEALESYCRAAELEVRQGALKGSRDAVTKAIKAGDTYVAALTAKPVLALLTDLEISHSRKLQRQLRWTQVELYRRMGIIYFNTMKRGAVPKMALNAFYLAMIPVYQRIHNVQLPGRGTGNKSDYKSPFMRLCEDVLRNFIPDISDDPILSAKHTRNLINSWKNKQLEDN